MVRRRNCSAATPWRRRSSPSPQTPPGRPAPRLLLSAAGLTAGRALPPHPGERAVTLLSVGRPVAGVALRILGPAEGNVPEGQVGEVAVAGACLFSGWHPAPAAGTTGGDGWYRTGDLGALVGGELAITGRRKEVIILRGRTFYAPDIEAMLQAVPGVHPGRAVALGVPSLAAGTQELVLLAETALDDPAARRALSRAIRARVEGAPAAWPAPLPRCGRPAGW